MYAIRSYYALEPHIELFLLQRHQLFLKLIRRLRAQFFRLRHGLDLLGKQTADEAGLDRQLGRGQLERATRHVFGNAVDFKHDPARLDAAGPELDRTLTLTLTDFGSYNFV